MQITDLDSIGDFSVCLNKTNPYKYGIEIFLRFELATGTSYLAERSTANEWKQSTIIASTRLSRG